MKNITYGQLIGFWLILMSVFMGGCSTVQTIGDPSDPCSKCPERIRPRFVYSGVRCTMDEYATYEINFAAINLPFSMIADTIVLPFRAVQSAVHLLQNHSVSSGRARVTSIRAMPGNWFLAETALVEGTFYRNDRLTCTDVSGKVARFTAVVLMPTGICKPKQLDLSVTTAPPGLIPGAEVSCKGD